MTSSPPRLPPVSGVLVRTDPAVVRPIAFRPVKYRQSTPIDPDLIVPDTDSSNGSALNLENMTSHSVSLTSVDNLPYSGHHSAPPLERHQNMRASPSEQKRRDTSPLARSNAYCHSSAPSLDRMSYHQSTPHLSTESEPVRPLHHRQFLLGRESSLSHSSGAHMERMSDSGHSSALPPEEIILTPSPSDSGITELEAILREKDAEISYLRETLEHNEQVIFKVYEEKEHSWQKEIKEMKQDYRNKMEAYEKRMMRVEQLLKLRTKQSEQLQTELEQIKNEKKVADQRIQKLQHQLDSANQWANQMSALNAQSRDSALKDQVEQLKLELKTTKWQLELAEQNFEDEKHRWQEEKERVIRYQKQLQMNYVQMYRRNCTLENELQQLSLHLDGRDDKHNSESHC